MEVQTLPIRDDVTPDLPTQRMIIKAKLGIERGKRGLRCLEPVRQVDMDNIRESPEKAPNEDRQK